METMSLEQVKTFAGKYRMVPIGRSMYADRRTPVEVLRILKHISPRCYIFESMEDSKQWGRYTFLGYEPQMEMTCTDGEIHIKAGTEITVNSENPDTYIRQIVESNISPRIPGLPPFTGGLVGYFSYDYIKYSEPSLQLQAVDDEHFQDFDLMLFDKVIIFDNLKQQIILIANVNLESPEENYNHACMELENMAALIRSGMVGKEEQLQMKSPFEALFDKKTYCGMVDQAKYHIKEGDIFQVVLSNRLKADAEGSLLDTYRVLRTLNPSPYMFYLSGDDMEIAGSSPETLVRLQSGILHTFPLAGTRKRGSTIEEDERFEDELLHDPKELAEHNMLVDLGRNDLGKISCFGSVQVERYLNILRYSHVMHIGSTICGKIRPDKTAIDSIASVLPAGTLSGAPKLRACQIIDKLEKNKRGIYGGAVGYIDFTGNMDMCIAIRLAYKIRNHVFVRSGAGIVADSVPESEYQECLNKAQAVVTALKEADGGIDNDCAC